MDLEIVLPEGRDLVVAGAMISILLNPRLFKALDRWGGQRVVAVQNSKS